MNMSCKGLLATCGWGVGTGDSNEENDIANDLKEYIRGVIVLSEWMNSKVSFFLLRYFKYRKINPLKSV